MYAFLALHSAAGMEGQTEAYVVGKPQAPQRESMSPFRCAMEAARGAENKQKTGSIKRWLDQCLSEACGGIGIIGGSSVCSLTVVLSAIFSIMKRRP